MTKEISGKGLALDSNAEKCYERHCEARWCHYVFGWREQGGEVMLRTRGGRKIRRVIKMWNVSIYEAWEIHVFMGHSSKCARRVNCECTPRKCDWNRRCEERHELFSGQ